MPIHSDIKPPYDSLELANTFLNMAWANNKSIDPMKLLKLIYFAHGWYLAMYEKPLIDEDVQAWEYGPVVPKVYHEFKVYGSDPITDYARNPQDGSFSLISDHIVKTFLDTLFKVYGDYTAIELSNMSHLPDSPWAKTKEQFPQMKHIGIPQEFIKEYFQKLAERDKPSNE